MRRLLFLCSALLLVSCADANFEMEPQQPADAGSTAPDAGTGPVDAAPPDDAGPPDTGPPDSGDAGVSDLGETISDVGFSVSGSNLAPATGSANSSTYRLRGGLRGNAPGASTSSTYQLRGRFVPTRP